MLGSFDISGEWVVVGAPLEQNTIGDQVGAIYFFQREIDCSFGPCIVRWPKREKEFNPTPQDLDEFGHAVAMEDNWVIAGDPKADITTMVDQGAIYPFQLAGSDWSWNTQELSGNHSDGSDNFGSSVALGRSKVLVGSPNEEDALADPPILSGMVYQFNVDASTQTWCEICAFYGNDPEDMGRLGISVSLDVSAAVGADMNGKGVVDVYDPKTGGCP